MLNFEEGKVERMFLKVLKFLFLFLCDVFWDCDEVEVKRLVWVLVWMVLVSFSG